MQKTFKRFLALFIGILMIFSLPTVIFADDGSGEADSSGTAPVSDGNVNEPVETDDEEIVATVSLFSCMYIFPVSGHTWIYVENLSDKTQRVGLYDLPAGQGVSIGSFSISVSDGWGIYYNVECYRENRDNNLDSHWSVTKNLTQSELDDLSEHLRTYKNYWGVVRSCSFFTFSIWNDVAGTFLIPVTFPAITQLEVMLAGAKKGQLKIYAHTADQVFRQIGTGDEAYLVHAGQETIDS